MGRVNQCFEQVGLTIFNGAVTTFVAGIFLYQCSFIINRKFGIFIMITISASMVFSLIFYPALSYLMGPEKKQGNLSELIGRPTIKCI